MKKIYVFILVLALALSGCGVSEEALRPSEPTQVVQMVNPWKGFDTLKEAETAVGFSLSMPEQIGPFQAETFRVLNTELLEICYCDGTSRITVRKQPGEGQDLSGIFDAFEKETVYTVADSYIVSRVAGNKCWNLIDRGGYSWSVYAPEGGQESFVNAILGVQPWVREANAAFNAEVRKNGSGTRASELSCFFSRTWAAPEEIDLAAFLRYCPLGEQLMDEHTEEAQAVIAKMGENPFLVTPVWRYPKGAVSSLLQKYTGITVDELHTKESVLYLEEYDAYYNCTSDWGPGRFYCTDGTQSGDHITLWGKDRDGEARILTIREENGTYYLTSFLKEE